MNIKQKGKLKLSVSIQVNDILPFVIKTIKEELDLNELTEVNYTSNTTFLTFDIIKK